MAVLNRSRGRHSAMTRGRILAPGALLAALVALASVRTSAALQRAQRSLQSGGYGVQYGPTSPMHVSVAGNQSASASTAVVPEDRAPEFRASTTPIRYAAVGITNRNAGPVLNQVIPVYLVFVGQLSAAQRRLVRLFVLSLSPSANPAVTVDNWWAINTRYYGGSLVGGVPTGGAVSPRVVLRGEWSASPTQAGVRGNTLGSVFNVVKRAIRLRGWPSDPNAIYAVLTGQNIHQIGVPGAPTASQCAEYCGWHYYGIHNRKRLVYAWQGIPPCSGCGSNLYAANGGVYAAPSADAGIHQAISTLAHELAEAASDPYLTSWYDNWGYENADKCQMGYGRVLGTPMPNGQVGVYNLVGARGAKFLIQQNWDPVAGACATMV